MCNIAVLKAGTSIPLERIKVCAYNNPHSFGLILKSSKNEIEVIRKCNKDGNDPEEIFDLLEDNKDKDRYLHLRWKTEGPIDLDNTHPFTAYHSDDRQVYFMHNGTLHDFRPKTTNTWENNRQITVNHEPNLSDSKKFNDEFLAPLLQITKGDNGIADITNTTFHKVVEKFWSGTSKGVLICNNLPPVFINQKDWKELDFGGGKFLSSNNDYWDKLSRGPVFEAQEAKRKEEEEAERKAKFQSSGGVVHGRNITNLKDIDLAPKTIPSEDLSRVFEDFNIWTDEGIASLCLLTELELQGLVNRDPEAAVSLLIHITSNYDELFKRKVRMTNYIKELQKNGKTTFEKADEAELSRTAA